MTVRGDLGIVHSTLVVHTLCCSGRPNCPPCSVLTLCYCFRVLCSVISCYILPLHLACVNSTMYHCHFSSRSLHIYVLVIHEGKVLVTFYLFSCIYLGVSCAQIIPFFPDSVEVYHVSLVSVY